MEVATARRTPAARKSSDDDDDDDADGMRLYNSVYETALKNELWLILAAALVLAFALYFSRTGNQVNVAPDAQREIEKARQR